MEWYKWVGTGAVLLAIAANELYEHGSIRRLTRGQYAMEAAASAAQYAGTRRVESGEGDTIMSSLTEDEPRFMIDVQIKGETRNRKKFDKIPSVLTLVNLDSKENEYKLWIKDVYGDEEEGNAFESNLPKQIKLKEKETRKINFDIIFAELRHPRISNRTGYFGRVCVSCEGKVREQEFDIWTE